MTVASKIAKEHYIPNISRDVFIDSSRNEVRYQAPTQVTLKKVAARKGLRGSHWPSIFHQPLNY